MILSFWTDMSGQTVQTQIRLLLEEQSDQGLHCLPFCVHSLDALFCGKTTLFKFRIITSIFRVSKFFYFYGSILTGAHAELHNWLEMWLLTATQSGRRCGYLQPLNLAGDVAICCVSTTLFLWRTMENDSLRILKYPPYLFH